MDTRLEQDSLGSLNLPKKQLWGIHTQRALENFAQDGPPAHFEIIQAMAAIKKSAARVNAGLGYLDSSQSEAIIAAAQDIQEGLYREAFPLPALQGGAGTSLHMNINEVLANLALIRLGHNPGDYHVIHPHDDVNRFQSTNDVFPSAVKMAAIKLIQGLAEELAALQTSLQQKEKEFSAVLKVGRTQLQDAMPMTLGQEFGAWSEALARDRWRVVKSQERLRSLNLGGTAIGTGTGAPRVFIYRLSEAVQQETGMGLSRSENTIDATQNMDCFVEVSGILKATAVNLIKISSDLRLLSSGPHSGLSEIILPARQAGSSLMPGKVNPVIAEFAGIAGMQVISLDSGISLASAMGQLELNAFLPLIAWNLLQSCKLLRDSVRSLRLYCIDGISARAEHCNSLLQDSDVLVTLLVPYTGYAAAADYLRSARAEGLPLRSYLEQNNIFSPQECQALFEGQSPISPGISGADALKDRLKQPRGA